jgi:heme/copper-type cytochrome/quinol oxidase subunit 2
MLIALAAIILAIVFSFRAFNSAEESNLSPALAENIRIAGILTATALALVVLGVIISFFMYGSMALRKPKNILGSNILFMGLAFIVAVVMIVALVYAWIAYTDAIGTSISVDVLIAALAITIAIASPFFSKGGVGSVPILGDNIFMDTKIYPEVTVNEPMNMYSEDLDDTASILIPKLPKRK